MKTTFACGCTFDVIDDKIQYDPNIEYLPLNCLETWKLICEGNTKGVFQLESQLGRSMAERVKPSDIEELSDLVAIIRPGCMEAIVDGKSLTQHYIDRKHGIDPVEYFHDALEPILSSTYGILVYQEQAILIARDIGGFDLQEADILRKAIGKKNVGLMAEGRDTRAGRGDIWLDRKVSKIFLQQVPLRQLRLQRLPHSIYQSPFSQGVFYLLS